MWGILQAFTRKKIDPWKRREGFEASSEAIGLIIAGWKPHALISGVLYFFKFISCVTSMRPSTLALAIAFCQMDRYNVMEVLRLHVRVRWWYLTFQRVDFPVPPENSPESLICLMPPWIYPDQTRPESQDVPDFTGSVRGMEGNQHSCGYPFLLHQFCPKSGGEPSFIRNFP